MKLIAVVTTVEKAEDARKLAREAVESRLAACAQLEPIESTYFWDGALEDACEIRITFKTRAGLWPELKTRILELHPYETPAVYSLEVVNANEPYSEWVLQNTREPAPCPN
jgi:periplasmic divalent cation tolerance protein